MLQMKAKRKAGQHDGMVLSRIGFITVPAQGDFLVEDKFPFEIGGKAKKRSQIRGIEEAYVVRDDIEVGFDKDIPLWLFGFLY